MRRPYNLKTSRGKDENGYEMYKNEKKYATLLFFYNDINFAIWSFSCPRCPLKCIWHEIFY